MAGLCFRFPASSEAAALYRSAMWRRAVRGTSRGARELRMEMIAASDGGAGGGGELAAAVAARASLREGEDEEGGEGDDEDGFESVSSGSSGGRRRRGRRVHFLRLGLGSGGRGGRGGGRGGGGGQRSSRERGDTKASSTFCSCDLDGCRGVCLGKKSRPSRRQTRGLPPLSLAAPNLLER